MSLLVVGLSYSSAPVTTLERAVVSGDAQAKLLHDVHTAPSVAGALVLSTCNRVEVYAEVDSFHGGVATICELLARHSGLSLGELTGSAYVHYQDRAAQHLLAVACGLESMVLGESQILGQVRRAVRLARQHGTLSRELSDVSRVALRAGKRAHAETGIDAAGQNLVTLGLSRAAGMRTSARDGEPPALLGLGVLVVGAGAMSSLAVATAVRLGAASVLVANRTIGHAERLAERYGASAIGLADLDSGIAAADVVVTCTGALGHVITASGVASALSRRDSDRGDLMLLDLALPRDVEPAVAALPGVHLVDIAAIATAVEETEAGPQATLASDADITAVRRIVAYELSSFLKADRAASVAPTVVALRAKAATVVDAELTRLERRLGDLDPQVREEIAKSMGRIADKLLHGPTVRVKELAGSPGAESYETALRVLFELDPNTVQAVGRADDDMLAWPAQESET
ncbi:MAG TPA: glutamyl-tRNA reductase [Streptosporangiaceae bacterium]|nr:glutamyl-tRNA reductase [Streptosporangiaceae bacterium]